MRPCRPAALPPTHRAAGNACRLRRQQNFSKEHMWSNSSDRHFDSPLILEIATHPAMVSVATALLGPDVLMVATAIFCKYGPRAEYIAPHQDACAAHSYPCPTCAASRGRLPIPTIADHHYPGARHGMRKPIRRPHEWQVAVAGLTGA